MIVYGKEIDFKISRISDAWNMELALKNMEKTEANVKKGENLTDVLRRMRDMFRQFFLDATGSDILEDCDDLEEAKKAYFEFLSEVKKQREAVVHFSLEDIK